MLKGCLIYDSNPRPVLRGEKYVINCQLSKAKFLVLEMYFIIMEVGIGSHLPL